jgi:hypothetical protein
MLEKHCVAYSCCSCFYDMNLERAMVFHGCPDVESVFGMGVPNSANVRFYMGLDSAPQGAKGFLM